MNSAPQQAPIEARTRRSPDFSWWQNAPQPAKKALFAASLGWMLDSFDVMLYSLVLASLMAELHLSKGAAGVLGSITLLAAAAGGLFFGIVADRFGRTRALMASVLIYAVFTAACGLFERRSVPVVGRCSLSWHRTGCAKSSAAWRLDSQAIARVELDPGLRW